MLPDPCKPQEIRSYQWSYKLGIATCLRDTTHTILPHELRELQSIAQELRHKPESKVDVLQLLKQINDCLHEWDNGREGEMRAQEWWNVRQTIQEAGYDIHEVAIWDSEGDMIIRRDLAIAPRMGAS